VPGFPEWIGRWSPVAFGALAVVAGGQAFAQTQTSVGVPGRGSGLVEVTLQHITITERELKFVREEFGEITLRSAYFNLDYGLTDRLALRLVVPFKSNRYRGDQPHDPGLLDNPRGETLLDDGHYHSNWGDWGGDLRYLWLTEPVAVTPFIGHYWPSNDYPLFTETQAGTRQWWIAAGANIGGRLWRVHNAYWQAGYAYSYKQKTRPTDAPSRRVNSSRLSTELGWMASPRLTVYGTLSRVKPHNALTLPDDFTGIPFNDQWFWHDQLLAWEYTTWSLGASWKMGDRISVSIGYGRSLDVKFGHIYDDAWTASFSQGFATRGWRR
jgi:hypothetical protein